MLHRLRPVLVIGALALLAVPATASARSFEQTYPRAARLCTAVTAGQPPAALAGKTAQAKAACDALKASLTSANTAFAGATAGLEAQMNSIGASARAACAAAFAQRNPRACRAALAQARAALQPLLVQWRTAARAQRRAISAAGNTFWTTVRTIMGQPAVTDPPPPPPVDPDPIGIT